MAAILETRVTVTQHGFHVKQPLQAAGGEGGAPAADAQLWREDSRREEGTSLSALSFASLPAPPAALTPPAPQPPACLQPAEHAHLTSGAKRLMRSVVRGLKAEQEPEAATEGLGGTYFFANEAGQKIAIMKPCDEEPLAPNNPKGFVGRQLGEPGLKPTVRVGEAASREVRPGSRAELGGKPRGNAACASACTAQPLQTPTPPFLTPCLLPPGRRLPA